MQNHPRPRFEPSISSPRHVRKAGGPAWPGAWAGRIKAWGSLGDREAGLQSLLAYATAEESTAPAFRKTGPDVCCRRSLKWSSCFLLLDDGFYRPVMKRRWAQTHSAMRGYSAVSSRSA